MSNRKQRTAATNWHKPRRSGDRWQTAAIAGFASLVSTYNLSVVSGDLLYLNNHWYVTHTGLLSLAHRRRCAGIRVLPVRAFCNPGIGRWAFKATVFKSRCL